ncbi:glycosyltransferase family 2 protein [Campylobacter lari]|uniref:glycosyltransferase family 2 protein n=1 Tax=Campylobacter lari TaxID=201 RepID=UPI00057D0CEB|nr:glycosyltransferase family A protein [Campylobacter lari]EAK3364918.1 glycosyltransferase family 2 protein [Campylobacter lari]
MMKISILTPCFNHEKYIKYFIQSILEQSFEKFELIIVDDYSSDDSVKEIQKFNDSRIKLIKHDFNQGINGALNTAFENSSGDYIVFCASDDMLEKNALEVIYNYFINNENTIAVYPNLTCIDENNNILGELYPLKKRSRIELLYHLFMRYNCLTSVGLSLKRNEFKKLYPLPISMCNYQDMQMHINILKNGDILILNEKLIKYRRTNTQTNISAHTSITTTRENLEEEKLLDTYLNIKDITLLEEIFQNEIIKTKIKPYDNTVKFFLGRMALESDSIYKKYWGYHKIMEFYNNKENAKILLQRYSFSFKDFLELAKKCDGGDINLRKYKKYKKLFNYSLVFSSIITLMFICILSLGL